MSYPEHEKLQKVKDHSQAIGEFLDWLSSTKHIRFAVWDTEIDQLVPQSMDITGWTSEYYGIDQDKLEQEKRAMLEQLRQLQEKST